MRAALLCLLAALAVASASAPTEVSLDSAEWSLTHQSTVYDADAHTTTFTYSLTAGANAVSHWILASSCSSLGLSAGQVWVYKTDASTGVTGYFYPVGQNASSTESYTLVFNGDVHYSSATGFAIKGGSKFASGTTTGPSCLASDPSANGDCEHPADGTAECSGDLSEPSIGAYPNYLGQTTVAGHCPNAYTLVRSFLSTTGPKAFTACQQKLVVSDTTAPELSPIQTYKTLGCNDVVPDFDVVTATDNCDDALVHAPCGEITNGTCPANKFYVRTWTATDSCGNSKCVTQTIAVIDNTPPTLLNVPKDEVRECDGDFSIPAPPTVTAEEDCDNCFANPLQPVTFEEQYNPGECSNTYELVRTWSSKDCCGNQASASQRYTVRDTTAPEIWLDVPANGTFECDEYPVDPYPAHTKDVCMKTDPVYTVNETRHNGTCDYNFVLTRVYTTSDDCGNTNSLVSVISVVDNKKPTWVDATLPPATASYECGHIEEPADPEASDTCGLLSVVRLDDQKLNGTKGCANDYVIVRTWVATDKCKNSITYTQTVTVTDTTATKLNPLAPLGPYQCLDDVPAVDDAAYLASITPQDCGLGGNDCNCDTKYTLTYNETVQDNGCKNHKTITRTYTSTDDCGNQYSDSITITVNDNTDPTFSGTPADTNQTCDVFAPLTAPTAGDNCDGPLTVSGGPTKNPTACDYEYDLVYTWSAVDVCGNTASTGATLHVTYPYEPVLQGVPSDVTVQCNAVPTKPTLTATVPCGSASVDNAVPDVRTNGTCGNSYTLDRSWVATDSCGKKTTAHQIITVIDTSKPTLSPQPADTEANCTNIPDPADVCASDNCDGVTLAYTEERVDYPDCTATTKYQYKLVRTWTATDICGNVASHVQTINVFARDAPTLTPSTQADLYVSCDNVTFPADPTATGICGAATVTPHHSRVDGSCPQTYTLKRAFLATDSCGNTAWLNYSVHVSDTGKPILPTLTAITNECTTPTAPVVTATDSCDGAPVVTGPVDTNTSTTCRNGYVLERVWTAVDACGNTETTGQVVTVYDNTKPAFTSTPADTLTFQCAPTPADTLTASDNCKGSTPVTFDETRNNGSCTYDYTLTRTWSATDDCSNTQTFTQTVTVKDTTAPMVGAIPDDVTVDCSPPVAPKVCATDNCAGVFLTFNETVENFVCDYNYDLVRTWTATDLCGQSDSKSQRIKVRIPNAPQWLTTNPGDSTVECSAPAVTTPTAKAACGNVTVADHSSTVDGDCTYRKVHYVSFSATDACNQVSWFNYTVTVVDNSPPVVTFWTPAAPGNDSFTCGVPPAAPVPTLYDNCGGASFELTPDSYSTGCNYEKDVTRVWTFTDACSNSFSVVQVLDGVHTTAPSFDDTPDSVDADCNSTVSVPTVTGKDSCDQPLTATEVTTPRTGSCADDNYEDRVYTLTDICGLESSYTQTVHYKDTFSPVLATPSGTTESNFCGVPAELPATATDNCDPNPGVVDSKNKTNEQCDYVYDIYHTYTATDRCGNVATSHATQQYTWSAKPTFTGLPSSASVTVECSEVPSAPTVTAKDACNNNVDVFYNETRADGSCVNAYTLTRYWYAKDRCGGESSYTQTIHVQDTTYPTFCNTPADVSVQCGFVPEPPRVSAKDNCVGLTLAYSETKVAGGSCCDYKISRVWTATDACGHVTTHEQIITVYDDIKPVLVGVPADIPCADAECPFTAPTYNVTAFKPALAVGYCVAGELAASTCSDNTVKPSTITVAVGGVSTVFTVALGTVVQWINGEAFVSAQVTKAGSADLYDLHLHLTGKNHGAPSAGSPVLTLDPICYGTAPGQVSSSVWDFYNTLTGNLTVGSDVVYFTNSAQESQLGLGANGANTNLGAIISLKQKDVTGAPALQLALDLAGDGTGTCAFNHTLFPHLCACASQVNVTYTTNVTGTSCNGTYDIYNTWCANDEDPTHTVCATQVIHVCDTTAPFFLDVPASSTIDCTDVVPSDNVTAADACGEITSLTPSEEIVPGKCTQEKTYVRTFVAVDDCGHSATTGYSITVQDVTAPILSGIPSSAIVSTCDAPAALAVVTASDDCQTVTPVESTSNQTFCPFFYQATYSYNVADDCGNTASGAYDYVILNPYPVVLSGVPADETIECPNTPTPFTVTASQTCQGDLTAAIDFKETTDDSNQCDVVITRTWAVADACNHTASGEQTVHIKDTKAPFWTSALPSDTTVSCESVPTAPTLTAGDACTAATVTYNESSSGPLGCKNHYVLTRQWVASDACGHSITHTQIITVQDITKPTINPSSVADATVDCKAVPAPPSFCASDNCDGVNLDYQQVLNQPDAACDQYNLVRTVVATDDCGNTATVSYTIYVNDTVAPTCTGTSDTEQECDVPVVPPADPTCEDHCSAVSITHDFPASEKLACEANRKYTYNFIVKDGCKNPSTYTSTITTKDTKAPSLKNVPQGGDRECAVPFSDADPTAEDNCDSAPTVHSNTSTTDGACAGTYSKTITWWAVDECGNISPLSYTTYNVKDTTNPFWTTTPLPKTEVNANCDDVPSAATLVADDTCGGATVNFTETKENGTCANQYNLYRTWVATDCSGNSITHTQTVYVTDTTAPSVTPAPADVTLTCKDALTVPAICANDECDGVKLHYNQTRTSLSDLPECQDRFTLFRKWTATDDCGNVATTSYTITVDDQAPPTCSTLGVSDSVYCLDEDAATPPEPVCEDGCSVVNVTKYTSQEDFCAPTKNKYWSWWIVDQCGNGFWHNVTVSVYDNKAPVFDFNPDALNKTASCADVPPAPTMTASDECSQAEVELTETNPNPANGECQTYTIKRVWVATDKCGNAATHTQYVEVVDDKDPEWTSPLPKDWTVSCDEAVVIPVLTASDNCGPAPVNRTEETLTPDQDCVNAKKTKYTWTATDACGHTISHSATVTVEDRKPPTITSVTPYVEATCDSIPAPPQVCCSDTCDGVTLSYNVENKPSGQCDSRYDLVRTWTCTDACGNQANTTQTVHVTDNTPPAWTSLPLPVDGTFECFHSDNMTTLTAVDACTGSNVTANEEKVPGGCTANYTLHRTWTTMDSCGNQQSYIQNITVADTIPPYANDSDVTCFLVQSYSEKIVIQNVSVLNNFFAGGDSCSPVHIVLTGCTSDQDAFFPGTQSCVYDNATDTLTIDGLINTVDPLGRMYTVTALIVDECGHSVGTERQIFLPLNASSATLRNLSGLNCQPNTATCESTCPCQTVDHYCAEDASFSAALEYAGVNTQTSLGRTTFNYKLVGGSANRIQLNIDTTKYQILSWTPAVNLQFGPQPGSYLTGITWWSNVSFVAGDEFSFTIAGLISAAEVGEVRAQVDNGDFLTQDQIPLTSCSVPALVSAPTTAPTFSSSTPAVSGTVSISGSRYGSANSISFGLEGVVVALFDSKGTVATSDDTLLRVAVSGANGAYAFNDVADLTNLKVIILEEGLFFFRERSSGRFLRATVSNIFGQGRYGPSQAAAASVNFNLLIDTDATPIYNRPLANQGKGFEGSAKPESYWTFLLAEASEGRFYEYSATKLAALQGEANALLPQTTFALASNSLRAAALNAASGRGFFDPYTRVQSWYLAFADASSGASGQDLTDANNFIALINGAADFDRS